VIVLHDDAKKQGWIVINMKDDWKRIFAFDQLRRRGRKKQSTRGERP